MEGMILVSILFLTVVVLLLGILFTYFAFRLIGQEIPIGYKAKDNIEKIGENFTQDDQIPLDRFKPRSDIPLKIKYSEKDQITKI